MLFFLFYVAIPLALRAAPGGQAGALRRRRRSSSACRSSRSACRSGSCAESSTARRGARSRWRRCISCSRRRSGAVRASGSGCSPRASSRSASCSGRSRSRSRSRGGGPSATWALEGAAIVWVGVRQQRLAARVLRSRAPVSRRASRSSPTWTARSARWRSRTASISAACSSRSADCSARGISIGTASEVSARRADRGARALRAGGSSGGSAAVCTRSTTTSAYPYRVQAALLFFTGSCVAFSRLHTRLDWRAARYAALAQLPLMIASAIAAAGAYTAPLRAHRLDRLAACVRRAPARASAPRRRRAAAINTGCTLPGLWLFAALGTWEVGWTDRPPRPRQGGLAADRLRARARSAARPARAARDASRLAGRRASRRLPGRRQRAARGLPRAVGVSGELRLERRPVAAAVRPDPEPARPRGSSARCSSIALWFVEGRELAHPGVRDRVAGDRLRSLRGGGVRLGERRAAPDAASLGGRAVRPRAHAALRSRPDVVLDPVDADRARRRWCSRRVAALRAAWLAGGALLLVVVAKLFVVDLSNVGTIARIVSFIGVGVLMLVVGYFSPVPPKVREEASMRRLVRNPAARARARAPPSGRRISPTASRSRVDGREAFYQVEVPRAVYDGVGPRRPRRRARVQRRGRGRPARAAAAPRPPPRPRRHRRRRALFPLRDRRAGGARRPRPAGREVRRPHRRQPAHARRQAGARRRSWWATWPTRAASMPMARAVVLELPAERGQRDGTRDAGGERRPAAMERRSRPA